MRLILRAAVFLWMTPLLLAESMAETATDVYKRQALLRRGRSALLFFSHDLSNSLQNIPVTTPRSADREGRCA